MKDHTTCNMTIFERYAENLAVVAHVVDDAFKVAVKTIDSSRHATAI